MRLVLLLALAMTLPAQTVYLRYGGASTRQEVTGVTAGTPCVVTVPAHGYSNGQLIALQFVQGMSGPGNIPLSTVGASIFKTKSVTANTFALGDKTTSADVACAGTWRALSGWVGQVQATTLNAYPRGYLDGSSGTLTASLATKAVPGTVNYDALISNATAAKSYGYGTVGVQEGWSLIALPTAWRATGDTSYLDAAKGLINGFGSGSVYANFWCDVFDSDCGTSTASFLDWGGFYAKNWANGFAMFADQMTTLEKQTFADKMLTGWHGEACTPTRVWLAGTVSFTTGSAVITGSGTSFTTDLIAGQLVYVNTANGTSGVQKAILSVDSATQITLTSTMAATGSGTYIWRDDPWSTGKCGFVWWYGNHTYVPNSQFEGRASTTRIALGSSDTTMIMDRSRDIPYFPVYAELDSEWVSIDSIADYSTDTVNITRGALRTTPATHVTSKAFNWISLPTGGKTGTISNTLPLYAGGNILFNESMQNLVFNKNMGLVSVGMTLCGVDSRGCAVLESNWNYWYDTSYWAANYMWSGVNWGSSTYGWDRWYLGFTEAAVLAKNSFSPAIDMSAEQWLLDGTGYYHIYNTQMADLSLGMAWGDAQSDLNAPQIARRRKSDFIGAYLASSHPMKPYIYQLMDSQGYYDVAHLNGDQEAAVFYMFSDAGATRAPLSDLPKYHLFTSTPLSLAAYPNLGHYQIIGRSSWDTDATMLETWAMTYATDHDGSYPYPGHYQISKNAQYLLGDRSSSAVFSPGLNTGTNQQSFMPGVGAIATSASASGKAPDGVYGQHVWFDRSKYTSDYMYSRANQTNGFTAAATITGAYRELLHLMVGTQDYVIQHDLSKASTATTRTGLLNYPISANTGSTSAVFSRTGGDITFTRGGVARMSSTVLLPAGATITDSLTAGAAYQVQIAAGTVAANTNAELLVVHRPSANTSDVMPSVSTVTSDANSTAMQIDDGNNSWAVVLSKDSLDNAARSVTTSFSGTGKALFTGLSAGTYSVTRDGSPYLTGQVVGTDGTLLVQADGAHTFALTQSEAAPIISIRQIGGRIQGGKR